METASNKNEIVNTISTEQNQIDNSNPVEEKTIQNVDVIREQYVPTSEVCDTAQTVAPVRMLYEMNKNLREIDRKFRGIDAFVSNELGYKDMISLCGAFNAEQIDAIAVAINQIQKGKAVIIGDSTGIGKGRICAAILIYAKRKGKKPIFITEKPNLFSDIYRDIIAIGMDDGIPLKFKGEEVEKTQQVNREFIIKAMKQDIQEGVFDLEDFDSDRLFKKGEKQYTEEAIIKYREEYFPDHTIKIFKYNKNKNYEQDIDGAKRFVPFIVNGRSSKTDIKDVNGNIIYSGLTSDEHKEILKSLSLNEYDCVLATYSQFSSGRLSDKINFVSSIADENIIVMDECFTPESKIDGTPIKYIKEGDLVRSFNHELNKVEYKKVKTIFIKEVKEICKVTFSNGVVHYVTSNHPYFSPEENDYVPIYKKLYTFVVSIMQYEKEKNKQMGEDSLYNVWNDKGDINGEGYGSGKKESGILFRSMHEEVLFSEVIGEREEVIGIQSERRREISANEREQSNEESCNESESFNKIKGNETLSKNKRGEWKSNCVSTIISDSIRLGHGGSCENIKKTSDIPTSLQNRHRKCGIEDSNRGGWGFASIVNSERAGFEKRESTKRVRVESIEILKQGCGTEFELVCPEGFVYNIEVEDNNNYFVEDILVHNCHNASGSSARGEYLTEIAEKTEAIVFASATYAKRPDNMPIYAVKTNIADAELSKDDLIAAIQKGGVAMQEILSSQLVSEGQMIRRERGYEGIDVNYITLDESCEATNPDFNLKNSHYGIVDKFVSVIREIITFVEKDINPIIEEKRIAHIERECDSFLANAIINGSKTEREEAMEQCAADLYNSSPYVGIFTIISQMYFSLKAEAVAEWAIHRMRQGKKPVIALASTMESILDYAIEESSGVKIDVDFAIVLKRRLAKSLEYTAIFYDGNIEKLSLSEDDLGGDALYNYERISEMIDNIVTGITISPIDFIEKRISEAGFSVEEVTGRNRIVEFDKFEETGYVKNRNIPNASDVFRRFNNNETDCIIINQAGSTGASAHSIKTDYVKKVSYQNDTPIVPTSLEDKSEIKQRVMIILQAEGDVNKEVQKRGRIFRTGQVFFPIYDYIISAIPSEKRLMMMLRNKLRSLDANTSSNQKQSNEILNVVDFLNQYGDDVVAQFLANNPEINEKIGHPVSFSEINKDGSIEYVPNENIEDLAHMVTGRISILNTDEQEHFYNEVVESYKSYESKLTQEGKWNLGVDSLDLQAEVIEKDAISIGNPEKKSVFGGATFIELCEVNNIRKPFTKKHLIGLYDSILSYKDSKGNYVGVDVDEYIANINNAIDERARNEYEHFKPIYEKSKKRELESLVNQNAIRKIKNEQKRQDAIISETKKITEIWDSKISALEDIFNRAEKFKKIVSFFSPKKIVSYNIQNKNFDGLAIGVKITDGAWLSANHLHLKIAFPSTLRQMELSFSSIHEIDKIIYNTLKVYNESQRDIVGKYLYNDWDEKIRELSSDRVKRYIVTGNILKAYGVPELSNSSNRLISYSTSDKKVKKGILLPDDFDPNDLTIKIPIESAKSIAVSSIGGGYKSLSFGDDGIIYMIPKSNMLILRREKTKRRLYHIDKDNQLAEYLDTNWISAREFYEAEIVGKDNVEKVIEHLYKKGIPMNLPFREFKEISKNYDTKDRFAEEDAISEIIRKYNEALELYEKEQDKNFKEASAVDMKRFNEIQKELYELKREKTKNKVLRFFVETSKLAQKQKEAEVVAMRDGGTVKTIAEIQEDESFKLISDEVEINEILSHFSPKFDDIDELTKQPYSSNIGGVFVRYENGDIVQVLAFEGLPDIQKPIFEIYPTNEYF